MQPNEALGYIVQLASDYTNQLPPSARMPTQQAAQQAIDCLAQFVSPPVPEAEPEGDNVAPIKPRKPRE